MKIKIQDLLAFSQHAPITLPRIPFAIQERSEPQATFSSILTCTFDSANAKPSYRPCTYTLTFIALAVCSTLSLSYYARTQTVSLMHRAQFLFLYILHKTQVTTILHKLSLPITSNISLLPTSLHNRGVQGSHNAA